ncbi:MAG TPA: HAD hydrolase-like protein [Friedmanniella sp.]
MRFPGSAVIDVVCWDWNGTLLDDAAVALGAMNTVLHEHGLPVLPHVEAYRSVFGFPVRDFYARLGISDQDFRAAAGRYLELFASRVGQARLHPDAVATLSGLGRLGVAQVLISATVADVLERQMAPHPVASHFDQILGITDAYAPSKADVVATWLRSSGHDPRRVLMIGDTNHDEEIAEELGLHLVRFSRGHQDPPDHDRHAVVGRLGDVVELVRASRRHLEAPPGPGRPPDGTSTS